MKNSPQILLSIFDFFKNNKIKVDGVLSLNKINYFPKLTLQKQPLLSTFVCEHEITNPYLSLGDADMEQMK